MQVDQLEKGLAVVGRPVHAARGVERVGVLRRSEVAGLLADDALLMLQCGLGAGVGAQGSGGGRWWTH